MPLARLIKGMSLSQAEAELRHYHKKASEPLVKLLHSAAANAEHNFKLPKSELFVKGVTVDQGPSLKRWMPRAMGRVTPIWKRTSHVTVVLGARGKMRKEKLEKEEKPAESMFTPVAPVAEAPLPKEAEKKRKRALPKLKLPKPKLPTGISRRFFRRKAI